MKLSEFSRTEQLKSAEEFEASYRHGFLIINKAAIHDPGNGGRAFHTRVADDAGRSLVKAQDEAELIFVDGAATKLKGKVTVGRTSQTDITLNHPAVSKFHAYFQFGNNGSCAVCDPGSTNGTTVNGTLLEKHKPVNLSGGETIVFGAVFETTYHTAVTLHKHMKMLRMWAAK